MKVAFCIPTTSFKRDNWEKSEDSYLWSILCQSLQDYTPQHDIKLFIGYDSWDRIFSKEDERLKFSAVFNNFEIEWFSFNEECKGRPTWIWNGLAKEAMKQGYHYMKILGDDVLIPTDKGWLGAMINKLKKNQNIGFSAGWSNNDEIPTQFLVHKTHYKIFGFIYPPLIEAWFCDNFMNDIYPDKFRNWMKQFHLLNCGGSPRYQPKDDRKLCQMLVRRYRPLLNRFLQDINK